MVLRISLSTENKNPLLLRFLPQAVPTPYLSFYPLSIPVITFILPSLSPRHTLHTFILSSTATYLKRSNSNPTFIYSLIKYVLKIYSVGCQKYRNDKDTAFQKAFPYPLPNCPSLDLLQQPNPGIFIGPDYGTSSVISTGTKSEIRNDHRYWTNRQVNVKSQKSLLLAMVGECSVVGRLMPPASHRRCPHPNT